MPAPAVSIVLPFRNAAATLGECLASITSQTLQDWELLALDDGSEDDSASIVAGAAARDRRMRLLQPGRVGLVAALNEGLHRARAPLVARMDADDVMHEERLAEQGAYLDAHPEVAVVASQVEIFPAAAMRAGYREYLRWQNRCLTPEEIARQIYIESPVAHPTVMFRRAVVCTAGGYREGDFPEDYDLWLRLVASGHRIAKIPRVLLRWRDAEGRASRLDGRYRREAFDRLRAEFLARDPRLQNGRDVVIWGAGRRTRLRLRHLRAAGVTPRAFVDIDPRKIGQRAWGVPVHAPEWLESEPRPFVLACVTTHGARDLIESRLGAMGYEPGRDYLAVG